MLLSVFYDLRSLLLQSILDLLKLLSLILCLLNHLLTGKHQSLHISCLLLILIGCLEILVFKGTP